MIPRQKRVCKPHSGLSRMHVHLAMPLPSCLTLTYVTVSQMSPCQRQGLRHSSHLGILSLTLLPPYLSIHLSAPSSAGSLGLPRPLDGCSRLPGDCQAGLFPAPIQPTHFLICTQASTCTGCCVNSPLHLQSLT